MFKKGSISVVFALFSFIFFLASVAAAPGAPQLLTFNGQLADDAGVPVTGDRTMIFRIYDVVSATPAQALWSSGELTIIVTQGYFSTVLGTSPQPGFPEGLFADDTRYIGVTVEGEELVPRKRLTSVPSALNAGFGVPSGVIFMWWGTIDQIPEGYVLCNGYNGTPNMIDRFIVGAGNAYASGATGGSNFRDIPAHAHTFYALSTGLVDYNFQRVGNNYDDTSNVQADHKHAVSGATGAGGNTSLDVRPAYIALFFIMKL